jgi:hypothetical protein
MSPRDSARASLRNYSGNFLTIVTPSSSRNPLVVPVGGSLARSAGLELRRALAVAPGRGLAKVESVKERRGRRRLRACSKQATAAAWCRSSMFMISPKGSLIDRWGERDHTASRNSSNVAADPARSRALCAFAGSAPAREQQLHHVDGAAPDGQAERRRPLGVPRGSVRPAVRRGLGSDCAVRYCCCRWRGRAPSNGRAPRHSPSPTQSLVHRASLLTCTSLANRRSLGGWRR